MSTKFSQFTSGGLLLTTDIVVGLRGGNNFQFDNLTGIGDALGNKIITWFQAAGVGNAVNYIEFQNNFTGLSPQISAKGTDTNIDLTLNAKGATGFVKVSGTGALFVPVGTTGQEPVGQAGMVRVNSTTGLFEFFNPLTGLWVGSGSSALANLTYVTNTNETADLPNSQPLSALTTGIMKVTTATGIISSLAIPLTVANGGTGLTTFTTAYATVIAGTTATGALQVTAPGTAGYVLTSNGAAAVPTYQPSSGGAKKITQAGHGFAVEDVLYLNGATWTKARADAVGTAEVIGMVSEVVDANTFVITTSDYISGLSGKTPGGVYFLSDVTAGLATLTEPTTVGNISRPLLVANTATSGFIMQYRGKIIPAAVTQFTDLSLTGSTTAADRVTYEINGAGVVTVTIPATTAIGFTFTIVGNSASGWVIQANAGQTVNVGSTPTTVAGTITSANRYDCITIKCVTANTTFSAYALQGAPVMA